jgi:hypothetical protein
MKRLTAFLLLAIVSVAQDPAAQPSLSQIIARLTARNDARTAALRAYRSTRTYEVIYKGFPKSASAKVVVRLDFTAPDNKQFTIVRQEGSKLLINRVIRKALESEQEAAKPDFRNRSLLNDSNYQFDLVGKDSQNGPPCYLVQVTPKREDKYLYDGRVCIDMVDYAVVRIEAKPAKNPSFWISNATIDHHNKKVGEFWVPSTNRSSSHVRLGGDAELKIDYNDYEITDPLAPAEASGASR